MSTYGGENAARVPRPQRKTGDGMTVGSETVSR